LTAGSLVMHRLAGLDHDQIQLQHINGDHYLHALWEDQRNATEELKDLSFADFKYIYDVFKDSELGTFMADKEN
jgi:hypothetical protein